MFWKKKKKTGLEALRSAAADRAHDAMESAQELLHQASDATKKGSRQHLSQAQEIAEGTADRARHLLKDKRHQLERRIDSSKMPTFRKEVPAVVIHNNSQNWLWLGVGLLCGTAIGVLLAPARGRRSRALVRDKLSKGAHKIEHLGEEAMRKAHDLSNRAEGVVHTVSEKFHPTPDDADNVTVADRVRSALGRLEDLTGIERINVDAYEGLVTLRGPVLDTHTRDAIISATRKTEGVREVKSDLIVE